MKQGTVDPASCRNCGGTAFEWGWVHPTALDRAIKFTPDNKSSWLGFAGTNVRARRCAGCGHLELFALTEGGEPATGEGTSEP